MADSRWRRLIQEDNFFPLGVFIAIVIGAGLGLLTPGWANRLEQLMVGGRVTPLSVLLVTSMTLLMIRVEFEVVIRVRREGQAADFFLVYGWLLRPLITMVVGLLFLGGLPLQRNGLMLLGAAPGFALLSTWFNWADVDPARTAP
jgi:ACR3 family arsenite transporter